MPLSTYPQSESQAASTMKSPPDLRSVRNEPTFANLFRALLTLLLPGLLLFFDPDDLIMAYLKCSLKWASFVMIIVPTFVLGFALLVAAAVVFVVGVLGLVIWEAGTKKQEDAVQDPDAEENSEQSDRESGADRSVLDPAQELSEKLEQRAERIAALTEIPEALVAEMGAERDVALEVLKKLAEEARETAALKNTTSELLDQRKQGIETTTASTERAAERNAEPRNGSHGTRNSTLSAISASHKTAASGLTEQAASSASSTSTAPQPNPTSSSSVPDNDSMLPKPATETLLETGSHTARRFANRDAFSENATSGLRPRSPLKDDDNSRDFFTLRSSGRVPSTESGPIDPTIRGWQRCTN